MGCDGGTIPTRDELVRVKKKPEKKERSVELATKWHLCALTQESLRMPIVACQMGRLYNKESVLEFLLDRSRFEANADNFEHLRSLRDVKELQLSENPSFKRKAEVGDGYVDRHIAPYICPITGLEMNGHYRFCYLYTCCCVLSERAIKQIKSDVCHKCGTEFTSDDMIVLNGEEEDLVVLRRNMDVRRQLAKSKKKSKKRKTEETSVDDSEAPSGSKQQKQQNGAVDQPSTSSSSSKSKLMDRKSSQQDSSSKDGTKTKAPNIQSDPKTSATYKSLFNTCAAAKNQTQGHWVTYNPQYFH